MPIGFVAAEHADVEDIRTTLGDFNHGGTFSHHPVAIAAADATLAILRREGLIARAKTMGERLGAALRARFAEHPHVGDLRGEGLFWGLELVADRAQKRPFPATSSVAWKVFCQAF